MQNECPYLLEVGHSFSSRSVVVRNYDISLPQKKLNPLLNSNCFSYSKLKGCILLQLDFHDRLN